MEGVKDSFFNRKRKISVKNADLYIKSLNNICQQEGALTPKLSYFFANVSTDKYITRIQSIVVQINYCAADRLPFGPAPIGTPFGRGLEATL